MLPLDSTPRVLTKLADSLSAEIYAWGDSHVVKLFRSGFPREAIDREARNAALVHRLRIPTPHPEGLVELNGRTGIVFERCHGPTLYELLVGRARPAEQLAKMFFEVQFGIHQCRCPPLPAVTRTLHESIHRAPVPDAVKTRAYAVLESMPSGQAVCHGDFHPVNVLLAPEGIVVIDWLDAGSGDPMYDVARTLLYLRYGRAGTIDQDARAAFVNCYERHCQDAWPDHLERLELWRLPVAVARLASVTDDAEIGMLRELIASDSGIPMR